MKIVLMIIVVCIAAVLMPMVIAVEKDSSSIVSITEIAGKDIADREAKNWNYDAKIIKISISKMSLWESKDGTLRLYTTGWAYIYRSNTKYLQVLRDIDDYVNKTARTREFSKEEIKELELDNKKSLDEWEVVSSNAIEIASIAYNMSLERGDAIYSLYLHMIGVDGVPTPVWYISIMNGISGIKTDYLINANTGEILEGGFIAPPVATSPPLTTQPDGGISPVIIAAIITGVFTIIAAVILMVPSLRKRKE